MDFDVDLDEIADDVESSFSVEFRDPYERPYGDPERTTKSQAMFWEWLTEYNVWRQALIGAKGAAKTYYGATFAFYFGQKFPGAEGAVVGNTDRQAKDAAGGPFLEVCRKLGYEAEYFGSKKLRGQEDSKFYVVDLDGDGYEKGNVFKLFVRSLEAVKAMEGSQYDFMWLEEIQQGNKDDFITATSRNRGTHIAGNDTMNPLFIAGMTESPSHWMYSMLEENMGFVTSDEFDPTEDHSVLREPVLTENKVNIGQAKIDEYYNTFGANEAERLIHAKRVSSNSNRAMYEYRSDLHRKGRMSSILCDYDPYEDLILAVDFNIRPMCGSLWQRKGWNPKWNQRGVSLTWNGDSVRNVRVQKGPDEVEFYDSLREFAPPTQTALVQVDEYEIWPEDEKGGGTRGLMRHVVRDYAEDHQSTIEIVGDAQGNSKTAASTESNWDIIRTFATEFTDPIVVPGLISNRTGEGVTGEIKWSNPPVEDTLTAANRLLQNAQGQARICFLPDSEYPSGGVAASVAAVEKKGSGKIDERRDRSDDREKPRTHWFDTVRYVAWYFNNEIEEEQQDLEGMVEEMKADRRSEGVGQVPEGMDPERYAGFSDEGGEGGWLDFGSGGGGTMF